eukprot:scaffold41398_cov76-Phaeocystis_antarctica.AAC.11
MARRSQRVVRRGMTAPVDVGVAASAADVHVGPATALVYQRESQWATLGLSNARGPRAVVPQWVPEELASQQRRAAQSFGRRR